MGGDVRRLARRWTLPVLLACSLHACSTFFAPILLPPPPRSPGPVKHFQHSHLSVRRAALGAGFEAGTALRQATTAASESESADEDDAALEAEAQAFFQAAGLSIRDIASMTVPQLKTSCASGGSRLGATKASCWSDFQLR